LKFKFNDITHTDLFKYVFHSGSDEIFVANVSKISTFNENVLDSKWTLASHTLRLVAASQHNYKSMWVRSVAVAVDGIYDAVA